MHPKQKFFLERLTLDALLVRVGDGEDDGHGVVGDAVVQQAVEVLALEVLALSHEAWKERGEDSLTSKKKKRKEKKAEKVLYQNPTGLLKVARASRFQLGSM